MLVMITGNGSNGFTKPRILHMLSLPLYYTSVLTEYSEQMGPSSHDKGTEYCRIVVFLSTQAPEQRLSGGTRF